MPVQKLPRDRYQLLPSVKFVNKKAEGEVDDHQPINKLKTIQGFYQSERQDVVKKIRVLWINRLRRYVSVRIF